MKTVKEIFSKILITSAMLVAVVMPTFADNGCENEDNDAIAAEFALCSIHAYNIGNTKNPSAADRELMRDVVAMKSELITQQMYRHYEQMESMLNRFKTQLEKAVLTSNLQVAGASKKSSDGGGATFKQTDRNVYLAGISNCLMEMDQIKQMECLNSNYTRIYDLSQNGAKVTPELKKQLANDFEVLIDGAIRKGLSDTGKCKDSKTINGKKDFQDCLDKHRSNINKEYAERNKQNKQMANPWATK